MSQALPLPGGPRDEELHSVPASDPTLADRREYSFQSMLQLAGELSVSLGLYETVDLLTLNLMGQFRTARSAVWLVAEESTSPTLVRHRGVPRSAAMMLGTTCAAALRKRFSTHREPILAWALRDQVGPPVIPLLEHARIALFAPLSVGDQLLGWLALGHRVDGQPYGSRDFEILGASLGIVSSSILNGRLYGHVLETNRQLRATNERMGELDRLKSEFLSNVNHELRTPLTITIGSLECVLDQGQLAGDGAHLVSIGLENARHLSSLVENLLMFSEVTRDQVPIQVETASIQETLEEWLRQRQPGVAAGLRELTLSCAPELLPATFDRARLTQILDELVDNAVKFTPQGSRIRLEADRHEQEERVWVRVRVIDDGPGIPEARLHSLFTAFQQVDGSSTRAVGGLGMGLAFCRELARRTGCVLSAASQSGRGTTFTLLVPAAERRRQH